MEGSPDTIVENPGRVVAARAAGVNRFSMGIQTFKTDSLEACDRRHTAGQVEEALKVMQAQGFQEVVVDLIRGLPLQTLQSFVEDAVRLAELGPDSIFVYRMRIQRPEEPTSRFWRDRETLPLPPLDDVMAMHYAAHQIFTAYGYRRVNDVQWTRLPNRSYGSDRWGTRAPLFAFGWQAYSLFPDGETYNAYKLTDWSNRVGKGEITAERAVSFNENEAELVWTLFNLKLLKLDPARFRTMFRREFQVSSAWSKVRRLVEMGLLVEQADHSLMASEPGVVLAEEMVKFVGEK